jgi:transposase
VGTRRALQPSAFSECRKINARRGVPSCRAVAGAKLQSDLLVAIRNPQRRTCDRIRGRRLAELRTALGEPLPANAHAKLKRLLARLELVLTQIAELERERDAVVETEASDRASQMIQQLTALRGIGVQSATVLVREAFVRRFANGKALGSYAGLASSPYSSGGIDREQGIGKAGNRRVRTVMVELAWLWTRYQPGAAQVCWFRERVGSTGRRVRKIMVVALARKLLIALWRFVIDGVLPEGAVLKPAA